MTLCQIADKSNQSRIETSLHTVLNVQFDRASFQRQEANETSVLVTKQCLRLKHMSSSLMQTQLN